jgi:hypothetical protein
MDVLCIPEKVNPLLPLSPLVQVLSFNNMAFTSVTFVTKQANGENYFCFIKTSK